MYKHCQDSSQRSFLYTGFSRAPWYHSDSNHNPTCSDERIISCDLNICRVYPYRFELWSNWNDPVYTLISLEWILYYDIQIGFLFTAFSCMIYRYLKQAIQHNLQNRFICFSTDVFEYFFAIFLLAEVLVFSIIGAIRFSARSTGDTPDKRFVPFLPAAIICSSETWCELIFHILDRHRRLRRRSP